MPLSSAYRAFAEPGDTLDVEIGAVEPMSVSPTCSYSLLTRCLYRGPLRVEGARKKMRSRNELIAAVSARTPVDDRERACINEFLTELGRLGDELFDEHANPVHVTASALIVGPRGIVLHRHKVLGTWVAPGGHIDPGEASSEAVVREASEETGLTVRHPDGVPNLVHVDVHPGPRGHTHLDLRYVLDGGDADPAPPPDESQDVAWFGWDDALAITEPHMKGIVAHLSTMHRRAPLPTVAREVRNTGIRADGGI